jgi:hypothetical protein
VVSIAGDSLRSITTSESVSFSADAFVSKCDGTGKLYVCIFILYIQSYVKLCIHTYIYMHVYDYDL